MLTIVILTIDRSTEGVEIMNIVIVNGSPRVNGATGKILKEIDTFLTSKGDVIVKHFNLSEYKMKFCKGCLLCQKTGKCIINDDGIGELTQELKHCDAVVLGSPTYGSNVTAQFKTLIDRGGFVFGQLLAGKYGFSVSTYENFSGKQALNIIEKLFLLSGASRRGSFLLKLNYNSDPFTSSKVLNDLHKEIDSFYNSVKTRAGMTIHEKLIYRVVLNLGIKPRMLKHREKYAGYLQRWKELDLL
jgi:multimeric flavodoxin WrbA